MNNVKTSMPAVGGLIMRTKGLIALVIISVGFFVPLYAGIRELPWHWVMDEYKKWWHGLLLCVAVIRTGERQ